MSDPVETGQVDVARLARPKHGRGSGRTFDALYRAVLKAKEGGAVTFVTARCDVSGVHFLADDVERICKHIGISFESRCDFRELLVGGAFLYIRNLEGREYRGRRSFFIYDHTVAEYATPSEWEDMKFAIATAQSEGPYPWEQYETAGIYVAANEAPQAAEEEPADDCCCCPCACVVTYGCDDNRMLEIAKLQAAMGLVSSLDPSKARENGFTWVEMLTAATRYITSQLSGYRPSDNPVAFDPHPTGGKTATCQPKSAALRFSQLADLERLFGRIDGLPNDVSEDDLDGISRELKDAEYAARDLIDSYGRKLWPLYKAHAGEIVP